MLSGLGTLHALDYLFGSLFLGGLVFQVCILRHVGILRAGNGLGSGLGILGAMAVFFSGTWFLGAAVDMAESWKGSDLAVVLLSTSFGRLWMARLSLLVVSALLVAGKRPAIALLVCSALPVLTALSGHAGAGPLHPWRDVALEGVHLLMVSVWTGGLFSLALLDEPRFTFPVVKRFSKLAAASTLGIALSGVFLASDYGVSFFDPWRSDYGKLLLVKVGLFAGALMAASVNHFIHLRNWSHDPGVSPGRKIRREIRIELTLLALAFLAAGSLTRLPLPGR